MNIMHKASNKDSIFVAVASVGKSGGPRVMDTNEQHKRVRRPVNAFILFANEQRAKLTRQFPYMGIPEISVRLGHDWHKLHDSQKTYYFEQAHQLELEHKTRYPDYEYCPNKVERRTSPVCIQPDKEEEERRRFKRRIMEYSSVRCLNPDLLKNSHHNHENGPVVPIPITATHIKAPLHGKTGFRHPIGPYQTRVSQAKQRTGDKWKASKSIIKATRNSGQKVKRLKGTYPWSWRHQPVDESIIAQNNLVSILGETTSSIPENDSGTIYSPSVIGSHLQDPQSQHYHEDSANRAYMQMQENNSFNIICDQVLEEGPHAGRRFGTTVDCDILEPVHPMNRTQEISQNISLTTSEDSSLPSSSCSDKDSELSDSLPSITSLISNSNLVEFPFLPDNEQDIQSAVCNNNTKQNETTRIDNVQYYSALYDTTIPEPSTDSATQYSTLSPLSLYDSACSYHAPPHYANPSYDQSHSDIDSIQPSLSITDLQNIGETNPLEILNQNESGLICKHKNTGLDNESYFLGNYTQVGNPRNSSLNDQQKLMGLHKETNDSISEQQSTTPNPNILVTSLLHGNRNNRSLLKSISTINNDQPGIREYSDDVCKPSSTNTLLQFKKPAMTPDSSTVPMTSNIESSKIMSESGANEDKNVQIFAAKNNCEAILLDEEVNTSNIVKPLEDLGTEADTTVDIELVNGKATCRFTVNELLNKSAQEVQKLMTSGKYEIFVVSTDN